MLINHIKTAFKEFPSIRRNVLCDTFVHLCTRVIREIYIKNYTANFALRINICAKFQSNRINSAIAIASQTDRQEYKHQPSLDRNILR